MSIIISYILVGKLMYRAMFATYNAAWVMKESFIMFFRLKTWFNFNHLVEALNKYLYWLKMTKVQVTNGRLKIWCPYTNRVRDWVTKTEYFLVYPSSFYIGELHIDHFARSRQGYSFPISRLLIPMTILGKAYFTDHCKLHFWSKIHLRTRLSGPLHSAALMEGKRDALDNRVTSVSSALFILSYKCHTSEPSTLNNSLWEVEKGMRIRH